MSDNEYRPRTLADLRRATRYEQESDAQWAIDDACDAWASLLPIRIYLEAAINMADHIVEKTPSYRRVQWDAVGEVYGTVEKHALDCLAEMRADVARCFGVKVEDVK